MNIGIIGLGKMGINLANNCLDAGHQIIGFDINPPLLDEEKKNFILINKLEHMIEKLPKPRVIWSMVPSGVPTELIFKDMLKLLEPEDIFIDGGNSNYKESVKRGELMKEKNIHFFDVGTSGGMKGAREGGCFMIGGNKTVFKNIEPLFHDIAVKDGYLYAGEVGSGHYLKMVHNGIEYGMMQAIGEGFDLLEHAPYEFNYEKVAKVWNNGSVIRSWLMELTQSAFEKDHNLDTIQGIMQSSGEGKWTVEESLNQQVSIPIITMSLMMRYRSLYPDTFSGKVVAALRNEFGGHGVERK
ncbi:TPA: phosphogluconate dehydrogenase (NAD(+)-dependent, decarboxylating) [Enterococcus faecalis]|uniref:phosphogluconate dehydrogenase (NAD(+)-dependent, decarboxylating) n=1 Tax=Enterococcus faecalis TaxID=1351 RepID=UPI001141DF2F|nr:decarboxylating 6-phosphogluconate dehydrogenase [Enterococcus faecalis]EHV0153108.1 decarboxylating 6-phosphogluconate dehydrogenase [Enterococcus faecalis]NSV46485.1 decarboxylating 6-phosphogluconate dehydrogenase [Enterococcus faecalis]TQA42745.1 decarboxylating 6-phosphogluconate dehydrogenase [Enterococcus faecalis]HDT8171233.1 decarboxylating 6-phosphogluconate dehydrogenase [Enterococcus faecalis]